MHFYHHQINKARGRVDALRAFGAEVIVCPTNVDPEEPSLDITRFRRGWLTKFRLIRGSQINTIIPAIQQLTMKPQGLKFG
jgi:hypothetical protein